MRLSCKNSTTCHTLKIYNKATFIKTLCYWHRAQKYTNRLVNVIFNSVGKMDYSKIT